MIFENYDNDISADITFLKHKHNQLLILLKTILPFLYCSFYCSQHIQYNDTNVFVSLIVFMTNRHSLQQQIKPECACFFSIWDFKVLIIKI